jgi:CBS domain-containing protein
MKSKVQDVMTRSVVSVSESAPFKEIVKLMEFHGVSALPVVDATGRVVGVVSEADLILKEAYQLSGDGEGRLFEGRRRRVERSKAAALLAADLMTAPAVTVKATATLPVAARLMGERDIKRLPVVDEEGRIVGIVSRVDLLRVFLRPDGEIKDEVQHGVIERTLWMDPDTIRITVEDGVVSIEGIVEQRSLIPIVVGLIHGVDGVVGVECRLSYEVDDVSVRPDMIGPWGLLPYGAGRS